MAQPILSKSGGVDDFFFFFGGGGGGGNVFFLQYKFHPLKKDFLQQKQ